MMIVLVILLLIGMILVSSVGVVVDAAKPALGPAVLDLVITFVPLLILSVVAWASVSLQVRRQHDIGLSGWWILAYVPISLFQDLLESFGTSGGATLSALLALAVALFLFAYPGTAGPNRFGSSGSVAGE